jgi:hypothetical protein
VGFNVRPLTDLGCGGGRLVSGIGLSFEPLVSLGGPVRTQVMFKVSGRQLDDGAASGEQI